MGSWLLSLPLSHHIFGRWWTAPHPNFEFHRGALQLVRDTLLDRFFTFSHFLFSIANTPQFAFGDYNPIAQAHLYYTLSLAWNFLEEEWCRNEGES